MSDILAMKIELLRRTKYGYYFRLCAGSAFVYLYFPMISKMEDQVANNENNMTPFKRD